jgi:hypothetical protein
VIEMFKTAYIPMDLQGVSLRAISGEGEKRAVDLTFVIRPFTRELAAELGEEVRTHLFKLSDASTRSEVRRIDLMLSRVKPQRVDFGPKDMPGIPLLTIPIAKISKTRVTKDTETDGFIFKFVASFEYPTAQDLLSLTAGLQRQHFITLTDAEQSLIDAMEGEARDDRNAQAERAQERRNKKTEPPATATH